MNTIEVDKYRFLEVSTNPNIIISLKGEKNFCELSQKDKSNFLKSNFKLRSYSEFSWSSYSCSEFHAKKQIRINEPKTIISM